MRRRVGALLAVLSLAPVACSGAPPTPPPPVPLDDRIEFAFTDVHGDPDWLASGFDSLWVKRDDGNVMRIDPVSHEVLATIQADVNGEGLCQGIGVDSTSIWACSGKDVVRIDPQTNEVRDVVMAGKIFVQGRIAFGANRMWVITGNADELASFDVLHYEVSAPVPLGAECHDLAVGAGSLWAICPPDNVVLRISSEDGSVIQRIGVTSPGALAIGTDAVWIGTPDGIARAGFSDTSAKVVVPSIASTDFGAIWATADAIWVRTPNPFLARIDPRTNAVVEQLASTTYGVGDVLELNGTLWASDSDGQAILAIRPTP